MTTDVPVTIDTSGVSSFADAIAEAVGQVSDTPVPIDVDVSSIAPDIDDAVAGSTPDPVPVTADSSAIPSEIDDAVAQAQPEPVVIEADTSEATAAMDDLGGAASEASGSTRDLNSSVDALGATAGVAQGSVSGLLDLVKGLGGTTGEVAAGVGVLGAATAGFFEEGLNAVSAGQRFDLVLGDMANKIRAIDINGLHTDVETLGLQFGSTTAEMENTNSRLFTFAINAGASKDKAVEFTQQVETLAARAISLNPQLGTLSEVTDALGPKLARGGRFASEFQIALTPAEIATRALADTGKTLSSELTVQEKAMAGAEIASERYGDTLAGTVAEGAKNAAVQVESLKAQFKESIETIGVPLVSPVLDLLREAEPDAALIAKDLAMLAQDVLPILSGALEAVSIPLQLIDDVLSAIPSPIITATALFFLLQAALDRVAIAAVADAGMMGAAFDAAVPEIALAAAAIVAITGLWSGAPPLANAVTRAIDAGAKAFDDYSTSVRLVVRDEIEAAGKADDFAQRLNDANVSVDELSNALVDGGRAWEEYATRVVAAAVANGASFDTIVRLSEELEHLRDANEASAKTAIDSAVSTGKLSKADADAAVAAAGLIDGKVNYARALDTVQPKIKAASDAEEEHAKAEQDAADRAATLRKAMDDLGASAPRVASALTEVTDTTGPTGAAMLDLATAIDSTKLSNDQLDVVAQSLGVDVDSLKKFAQDAGAALDDFVSTAQSKLPTLSSAIDDALDPKKRADKPIIIDPKKLQKELDDAIAQIDAFNMNLAFLAMHGFDNLEKVAAERGPAFTDGLVKSIQKGGDAVGSSLDDKFAELNQKTAAEGPLLRDAGSGIITATGDIAAIASTDFQGKFDLVQPTQAQVDQARLVAELANVPFADALRAVAGDGAVAYEKAIGAIPSSTATALTNTEQLITDRANPLNSAAAGTGSSSAGGFASGLAPVVQTATAVFANVSTAIIDAARPLQFTARTQAELLGKAFDDGLGAGIDTYVASIESAAARAVQDGINAARKQAGAQSPSTVMAELGADMAAGLTIGLLSDSGPASAARAVVADAIDAARSQVGTARVAAASDASPVSSSSSSTTPVSSSVAAGGPAPLMNIEHATFGDSRVLDDLEWHAATTLMQMTKVSGS